MTHPMNSNPFPAAFVNCKASLQVTPITMPGGSALVEWRIDLLTEQQHVQLMTKAMDDIMIVGLTSMFPEHCCYMLDSVAVDTKLCSNCNTCRV